MSEPKHSPKRCSKPLRPKQRTNWWKPTFLCDRGPWETDERRMEGDRELQDSWGCLRKPEKREMGSAFQTRGFQHNRWRLCLPIFSPSAAVFFLSRSGNNEEQTEGGRKFLERQKKVELIAKYYAILINPKLGNGAKQTECSETLGRDKGSLKEAGGCCWHAGWVSMPHCLPHLSGFISAYHPPLASPPPPPSPPPVLPSPPHSAHTLHCAVVSPSLHAGRRPGSFHTTATGGIVRMHDAHMCTVARSSAMYTLTHNDEHLLALEA